VDAAEGGGWSGGARVDRTRQITRAGGRAARTDAAREEERRRIKCARGVRFRGAVVRRRRGDAATRRRDARGAAATRARGRAGRTGADRRPLCLSVAFGGRRERAG
jgi:hypothetical protein